MAVGDVPAIINRISYTGDLGYEIYMEKADQAALYHLLHIAGGEFGLRPFGMRAMMSLRLEKVSAPGCGSTSPTTPRLKPAWSGS